MEPELKVLTLPQLKAVYDGELIRTFPAAELMPYDTMVNLTRRGLYDMEGFFEGDTLLGYAMLCIDKTHDYALIDYLGVVTDLRNNGLGLKLLLLVEQHCSGYLGLLAEAEAPSGRSDDNPLIMRRLLFYARAGFVRLPYDMSLFGIRYQTLIYPAVSNEMAATVLAAHQRLYHGQFSLTCYKHYVQLPLGDEPLRPFSPWTEE